MGLYVNPKNMEKEEWLLLNATACVGHAVPLDTAIEELGIADKLYKELYPVCLVNNGSFTAAAVCYCSMEKDRFNDESDPRPRMWLFVTKERLATVLSEEEVKGYLK